MMEQIVRAKNFMRGGSSSDCLLPGLPDDITIDHVLTKVPWRTLSTLPSLNRVWRDVLLGTRQVYNARVRSSSTQTLIAMSHMDASHGTDNWVNLISLYDPSSFEWHLLPQIPGFRRGFPNLSSCVSSQGKLYIIGGANKIYPFSRNEVHMFDPAGLGRWQKCASMATRRQAFTSGVSDGKIYVFGGVGAGRLAEVYDPSKDLWNPIAPMLSVRLEPKAICVKNEFFLHSGLPGKDENIIDHVKATFAEVYNVRKNEWRRIDNFTRHGHREILVEIGGKLHRIYDSALDVYNQCSNSWEVVQKLTWNVLNCARATNLHSFPASAVALDGELMALVYRYSAGRGARLIPLKSRGLGLKNTELEWYKIPCSVPLQWGWLCCLQL